MNKLRDDAGGGQETNQPVRSQFSQLLARERLPRKNSRKLLCSHFSMASPTKFSFLCFKCQESLIQDVVILQDLVRLALKNCILRGGARIARFGLCERSIP